MIEKFIKEPLVGDVVKIYGIADAVLGYGIVQGISINDYDFDNPREVVDVALDNKRYKDTEVDFFLELNKVNIKTIL